MMGDLYENIGYQCMQLSAKTAADKREELEPLIAALKDS